MKIIFNNPQQHSFFIISLILNMYVIFISPLTAQNLHEVKIKTPAADLSFEQGLKLIEQNTKFSFTYNKETLPLDLKVKLIEEQTSLYDILYNLAKNTGVTFHRISNQIVIKKATGNEKYFVSDEESNLIKGKVIDSKTKEPLPYVSIYLSGTSIGTTTNKEGIYLIKNIPGGKYNLVASIVGYEPKIAEIEINWAVKLTNDFSLEPIVYKFNQVEITAKIPEKWNEQLKFFKTLLLGKNKFAEECLITNEYKFEFVEDDEKFAASINEPLLIINKAFGYKLDCVLKDFVYDKRIRRISYVLYPAFTEIISKDKDSSALFMNNRKDAYFGSLAHLLTCLSQMGKEFSEEGFQLGYIDHNLLYGSIDSAKQIVTYNSATKQFFLNPRVGAIRKYKTWHSFSANGVGIIIRYLSFSKDNISELYPTDGERAEFDSGGYFVNPNECIVHGDMAKEGVATMLPRFWKSMEEE